MFNFVEAPTFTKLVGEYLSDGDYVALQHALSVNAKNVAENTPVHLLRRIRKEIEDA